VDYYDEALRRVDAFFERSRAAYPKSFACREGCSLCCRLHLTLFPIEAARVGEALKSLPVEMQDRVRAQADRADACPLLVDDRCSVYESRPMICRSHGLPIKIEEERDTCPLNFTQPPLLDELPDDAILDVDGVNTLLAAINLRWSREHGVDPGHRASMADIIREV
jgi:hypothetical protein